jgi:hypothetical protein
VEGSEHSVFAGALGLLTLVVALSLLVFMAFTIILIPLALLGILMLGQPPSTAGLLSAWSSCRRWFGCSSGRCGRP